ncbi:MAG: T9SS type A sorting domain-containing protein [Bacteroidetes bacterium]|nr:T9SS type A sorting domain-containing protein [Bacteroidota bacterium]
MPTTSNNSVTGTWLPALDNTTTTTYNFTPTAGQCATTQTLTITVNPIVTPAFTAVAPICSGATLSSLPTTSTNSITGTWSPALDNTTTTTYNFSPTAGQCATTQTLTITVNPVVTPTFASVAAICAGETLSPLPTTSTNSITGTWSPALNNATTTTYNFTPTAGQCALSETLTITVNPMPALTTSTAGNTITSDEASATYQWIDCNNGNAIIAGETNQSYTASASGDFAVIVSNGNCSDTSACVNITVTNIASYAVTNTMVYPNPTTGILNIQSNDVIKAIVIYNTLGAVVKTENEKSFTIAELPVGVYFINIQTENNSITKRIVKQ